MDSARVRAGLAWRVLADRRALHVPPGHPYSPIPSAADVARALRWAGDAAADPDAALAGIDLREADQVDLLDRLVPLAADLPFGERPAACRYGYDNDWLMHSDGLFYALMLRWLRPRRVVEVGSGWSSALALDVDERFLGGDTGLTFIDPDADRLRSLARPGDLDGRLLQRHVQEVPLDVFTALQDGDVLFIDSSHVIKAGSDVAYLLGEVLPRLADGVHVHVHDVFYPFEYPAAWLRSGAALNEAYAVRLLLQHTSAYRIVLWNSFLQVRHRERLARDLPRALAGTHPTGGIWLRRT